MEFNATRNDFKNSIIINRGYCSKIFDFIYNTLNNNSETYYNYGYYGWNWSIYKLNNTFNKLRYNVFIINSYRNEPTRNKKINYNEIEKYFNRIIKNYYIKSEKLTYKEEQKLKKVYINKITKKLNEIIEKSFNNTIRD